MKKFILSLAFIMVFCSQAIGSVNVTSLATNSTPAINDYMVCVDVSDTTESVNGTFKKCFYSDFETILESFLDAGQLQGIAAYATLAGPTFTGVVTVPQEVYGAGWNGDSAAADRDSIYDKIETIVTGSGAPTDATYLTTTANGSLSAEVVTGVVDDTTLVFNGTTAQAKTLPSCSNATTSKLLYNNSTNEYSCGTDQSGGTITGTDTQVTFFDGANTPAGDAGFTYNKTTDTATVVNANVTTTLTVGSSATATITGGANSITTGSNDVFIVGGTFDLPSGTGVVVDSAGEMALDTTQDQLVIDNGSRDIVLSDLKTINIPVPDPTDAMSYLFFRAPYEITILSMTGIVDPAGTGESAVFDVQECNSTGDSCSTIDAAITADNDGANDDGSLSNAVVDADDWLLMDLGTITGTVSNLTVQIKYRENRK